ncbi:Uncharacterised protein [Mycobacterium tuberculosis]|nr:Uncharacterised protein [Mycobacterium tuberculosis]
MTQHELAVHGVGRIVGGGQHVCGSAEWVHLERFSGALGRIGHRGGQIRGEVLRTTDGLIDSVPTAHGIEVRVSDPVDRACGAHALIQRVGVLHGFGTKERVGILGNCH